MLGCLIWLIVLLILSSMVAYFVAGVLAGVVEQPVSVRIPMTLLASVLVGLGVMDATGWMGNAIEGWISIGGDLSCLALLGAGYLMSSLVIGIQTLAASCCADDEADSEDSGSAAGAENQFVVRLYILSLLKGRSMSKIYLPTPDDILNARDKEEEIDEKTQERIDSIIAFCVMKLEMEFKGYNCVYVSFSERLEIPLAERIVSAFKEKGWKVVESSAFSTTFEFSRLR